jgi:peptide deformylase
MILDITQYGNPILRKKCRKVTEVTEELEKLGEDLIETMVNAQGVGLAAPQVERDIQMAVVDV